jgi:hypothetical protein
MSHSTYSSLVKSKHSGSRPQQYLELIDETAQRFKIATTSGNEALNAVNPLTKLKPFSGLVTELQAR